MPATTREITAQDVIPVAEFAEQRRERRAALLPIKRLRRIDVGPYCTFYFESFETMLFQIQEMLLIEKGGEAQLADELAAYNPLIPKGRELVATVMFEVDEPVRRAKFLGNLGGVERHFYLQLDDQRIDGAPEEEDERTRDDGKTSAVHFIRFQFTDEQAAAFRAPATKAMIGCNDPRYAHIAVLSPAAKAELA
ncbi:MAG: hypothetical protein JWN69_2050, partial [Alphaproteobacteria bacterium]|nr:hypothetical protein [Alphaproteobacteria bacterium]